MRHLQVWNFHLWLWAVKTSTAFLFLWQKFLFKESVLTYRKSNGTTVARQQGLGGGGARTGVFARFSEWATVGVTMVIWHPNVAVGDLSYRQRQVNQLRVLWLRKRARSSKFWVLLFDPYVFVSAYLHWRPIHPHRNRQPHKCATYCVLVT